MDNKLLEDAQQIGQFLLRSLTSKGIVDPEDNCIWPHAYTTEYFAWLSALLYQHTNQSIWLDSAVQASSAALSSMENSRFLSQPSGDNHQYHWEFKNLALIHIEELIGDYLPSHIRSRLIDRLLAWQDLNIDSANWTAMRVLSYEKKYRRFNRIADRFRSQLELMILLNNQTPEGFFPDTPSSYSMQYHAYILALLAQYNQLVKNRKSQDSFLKGIRFIADFVDPEGDFNYYGRGQRQLFGYASLIFALTIASELNINPDESLRYKALATRIAAYVRRYKRHDGDLPLVLNHSNNRLGWYNYNIFGDYLAFCGVMFMLAVPDYKLVTEADDSRDSYTKVYPGLGLAVVAKPAWFAVFSSIGRNLSEPIGVIHLWPDGFTCLGGPDLNISTGIDYSGNYFGITIKDRPVMQILRARLIANNISIKIYISSEDMDIEQIFNIENNLSMTQRVVFNTHQPKNLKMISSGWSPNSKFQILDLQPSPRGEVYRYIIQQPDRKNEEIMQFELTKVDLSLPDPINYYVSGGHHFCHHLLIRLLLKAIWTIWVRWLNPRSI